MLDALVSNLIESFADVIASTAMTVASDHQERRDKLADYEAKARQHAAQLLTEVVARLQPAVRNRYQDWLAHPRLGHEPPAAELKNAEIGLNEAVMALKENPSWLNRAFAIGASIRLTGITEALGAACIYQDAAKRPSLVAPKRATKPIRADDKRLNRRAPVLDDVPDVLRPVVARLGVSHPERAAAIRELEAQRGGVLDADGIVTRLAALVAQADHQAFVEALAAQAPAGGVPAEAVPAPTHVPAPPPAFLAPEPQVIVSPTEAPTLRAAAAMGSAPRTIVEIEADVATVTRFVTGNRWALVERAGRYTLKKLNKRPDINTAFDRVAGLSAMQEALGRIHASQWSSPS